MRRPRDSAVLRRWLNGTCAVLVLGLVSCGANLAAEPAPTGVPSSPTASAEAQVSSSASQEALNAEAERVYRAFFAEEQKVIADGGAPSLPAQVREFVMGDFAAATEGIYKKINENNWKYKNDTAAVIISLEPLLDSSRADAEVTLEVCIDSRKAPLMTSDGIELPGAINRAIVYLKSDSDDVLKIYGSAEEVVDQCGHS